MFKISYIHLKKVASPSFFKIFILLKSIVADRFTFDNDIDEKKKNKYAVLYIIYLSDIKEICLRIILELIVGRREQLTRL